MEKGLTELVPPNGSWSERPANPPLQLSMISVALVGRRSRGAKFVQKAQQELRPTVGTSALCITVRLLHAHELDRRGHLPARHSPCDGLFWPASGHPAVNCRFCLRKDRKSCGVSEISRVFLWRSYASQCHTPCVLRNRKRDIYGPPQALFCP